MTVSELIIKYKDHIDEIKLKTTLGIFVYDETIKDINYVITKFNSFGFNVYNLGHPVYWPTWDEYDSIITSIKD